MHLSSVIIQGSIPFYHSLAYITYLSNEFTTHTLLAWTEPALNAAAALTHSLTA